MFLSLMLVSISAAAACLGVCTKTLRRWEQRGVIHPLRTCGNHRRYDLDALSRFRETHEYQITAQIATHHAAVYARVSANKQKRDLEVQRDFLVALAQKEGFRPIVYEDIASGLNDRRKGLLRLFRDAFARRFDRVYLTYLDRMARFGTHLLGEILHHLHIEVIPIHSPPRESGFELGLTQDVIAIITSYSGKLHRLRRGKNRVNVPNE